MENILSFKEPKVKLESFDCPLALGMEQHYLPGMGLGNCLKHLREASETARFSGTRFY